MGKQNRSTTDQIFWIQKILEREWEYNGSIYQLFRNLKKVYGSVQREVLYNVLSKFGLCKKHKLMKKVYAWGFQ